MRLRSTDIPPFVYGLRFLVCVVAYLHLLLEHWVGVLEWGFMACLPQLSLAGVEKNGWMESWGEERRGYVPNIRCLCLCIFFSSFVDLHAL
jgi:hypothetical protein